MQHAPDRLAEMAGTNFKGTAQQQPARLISALLNGVLTVVGSLIAVAALAAEPIEIIVPFGPSSGAFTWWLVRASNSGGTGPAGNGTAGPRLQDSSGACP